jgi:hypothetical protein
VRHSCNREVIPAWCLSTSARESSYVFGPFAPLRSRLGGKLCYCLS